VLAALDALDKFAQLAILDLIAAAHVEFFHDRAKLETLRRC
jgi:hypothetical protein